MISDKTTFTFIAICILLSTHLHAKAAEKTNFVLCMTDDQGWGDVGYMGHPHLKTPVIDERPLRDFASTGSMRLLRSALPLVAALLQGVPHPVMAAITTVTLPEPKRSLLVSSLNQLDTLLLIMENGIWVQH